MRMRFEKLPLLLLVAVASLSTNSCADDAGDGRTGVLEPLSMSARVKANAAKPTIVLVHGAFADASGWSEVIGQLQRRGYSVVAVQNPLTSLEADVAMTRRILDAQPGNVVAVGHSYGGAVISGASAGSGKVKALVFIAAFAPDAGEPVGAVGTQFAPPPLATAIVPDAAGFVYIDTAKFRDVFAADLPARQTRVMAATQKPLFGHIFAEANPGAGWKTIPSWYLVASEDRAINPEAERFYAKRMNARTREIESSHVPFLSRTDAVVKLILEATATVEN